MTKTETTKQYQVYLIDTEASDATPVSVPMSDEAARQELDRIKGEWIITRHLGDSRWYEVRPAS